MEIIILLAILQIAKGYIPDDIHTSAGSLSFHRHPYLLIRGDIACTNTDIVLNNIVVGKLPKIKVANELQRKIFFESGRSKIAATCIDDSLYRDAVSRMVQASDHRGVRLFIHDTNTDGMVSTHLRSRDLRKLMEKDMVYVINSIEESLTFDIPNTPDVYPDIYSGCGFMVYESVQSFLERIGSGSTISDKLDVGYKVVDQSHNRKILLYESVNIIVELVFQEDPCSICLGGYEYGEEMSVTKCYHAYHHKCLAKWTESASACPLCREELDK